MNRDTIIGFVLIAVVLIGFSWYNSPSKEEIEAARQQDSIAAALQNEAKKTASRLTLLPSSISHLTALPNRLS